MKDEDRVSEALPVSARLRRRSDHELEAELRVWCERQRRAVPIERCAGCEFSGGLELRTAQGELMLLCTAVAGERSG